MLTENKYVGGGFTRWIKEVVLWWWWWLKLVLPSLLCEKRLTMQAGQQNIVLQIISAFSAILEIILKAL